MKENDINEIMQWYNSFIEIVRQLSISAEEQIQKLEGTVVTDEIASDYSEIGMHYAQKLLGYGCITQEQFKLAEDIEKELEQMTNKRELWNDDALLSSTEWDNRANGYMLSQENTDLYIVPYQNAGFPGNGYKYTLEGLIGGE